MPRPAPPFDTLQISRIRAAAQHAWSDGDWRHAAELMNIAEELEQLARERAHGLDLSALYEDDGDDGVDAGETRQ